MWFLYGTHLNKDDTILIIFNIMTSHSVFNSFYSGEKLNWFM